MNIKLMLIKLNWFLSSQLGLDFKMMLFSFRGIIRYFHDLIRFKLIYKGSLEISPCLHDWYQEGGVTGSEYFWQDLIVARMIFEDNPLNHLDVGSRIDGFVAHLASFREVDVLDVRPVTSIIPGLNFKQADLSKPLKEMNDYYNSVSCLHALEHFGLGRYGDSLDPDGYIKGFINIVNMLKANGTFYLSVPVGIERVEFNANRVFNPHQIIRLANENSLEFKSIIAISSEGAYSVLEVSQRNIDALAKKRYTLCIFLFKKV